MNITFKSQNGCCPEWVHDGVKYYLFEDYDGTWTLMSVKIGCTKKTRFYSRDLKQVYPTSLLERFFKGKKHVKYEKRGKYSLWFWNGKQFITDGKTIVIKYISQYERPSFDTYLECLNDAKDYLSQKYDDGQMNLFSYYGEELN